MCLRSCFKEPFVAEKDLIVWKAVQERTDIYGNKKLLTPYMYVEVDLGKELEPWENIGWIGTLSKEKVSRYSYERGWIHGWICPQISTPEIYGWKFIKSIIPKGTKFMVGHYLNDICSKKLIIGKEVQDYEVAIDEMNDNAHLLDCLEYVLNKIDKDSISEGWLYLNDGSFIHPIDCFKGGKTNEIIGIVIHVKDNKALVEYIHQFKFTNFIEKDSKALKEYIENNDRRGFTERILHIQYVNPNSIVSNGWLVATLDELEILSNFKFRTYLYSAIQRTVFNAFRGIVFPDMHSVSFSNEFKIRILETYSYNIAYNIFLTKEVNL